MPTYTWRCEHCQTRQEAFLSIREYSEAPPTFVHCGKRMERVLERVHLAVVSEDSYKDLRAQDGTDISSRAKHREYMRARNLTTIDDFKDTWAKAAAQRAAAMAGDDASRKVDLTQAIAQLGG